MTDTQPNCIFCKIVKRELPESEIVYESPNVTVIKDIRPASQHHYLALSKCHIPNVKSLTIEHKELLIEMKTDIDKVFEINNIDSNDTSHGFHWPPFCSIGHLHMHGIAPVSKMGFLNRVIFRPSNIWYCTYNYIMQWIETKQ